MKIEGKFTMKAPLQKVWDFLLEPGTLASCIPGAEKMEAVDDKTWEGTVKQKVGPISVKLNFTQTLTEVDPPKHIKAVGRGSAVGGAGTFSQETIVDLKEIAGGEVEVAYSSKVSMVGRLATFGERIMRAKVNKIGEEFTRNLQEKLKSQVVG
ncbi:MAG: carbon monoxide dehydrogenase subunit G [Dehalococcoidales bacterium]|nr:carbon monoxide dehydrogenase subunit G [Dehalococcoidales bacterium]